MKKSTKNQTETYIFTGVVLPERAQLSFNTKLEFSQISTKKTGKAEVSIILNQILVIVETDRKWDIVDSYLANID